MSFLIFKTLHSWKIKIHNRETDLPVRNSFLMAPESTPDSPKNVTRKVLPGVPFFCRCTIALWQKSVRDTQILKSFLSSTLLANNFSTSSGLWKEKQISQIYILKCVYLYWLKILYHWMCGLWLWCSGEPHVGLFASNDCNTLRI